MTASQRIKEIIDYAYALFCNQVVGGYINIENEASMQLHLSNILLQLGRLNIFSSDEFFNIILEKKITLNQETCKSKNRQARVDIWIEFKKGDSILSAAAIELKYFRKANPAVTDERHSVYADLENLEQYASQCDNLMICEIVFSDNQNFPENRSVKFSIADDTVISSYKGDATYSAINLSNQYELIKWDRFDEYNFLKITTKK